MAQNTQPRRIRFFRAFTLICFGCMLLCTTCNQKPELTTVVNDIQNPNSALVKALNCDESLGLQDGWTWETKVITQRNKDSDGYEWTDCRLGGHYDKARVDQRYDFVFFSGIEKYKSETFLDGSAVATISGKEIATPNFVKLGQAMFSRCAEYKEYLVHCLINIQYDAYTTSNLRIDFDNRIPLSSVETLANTILTQQDALIRKVLLP